MSPQDPASLIRRYRSGCLLIDTNLLIVYVVGKFDPNRIQYFKRTKEYTIDGFIALSNIIHQFNLVITSPNILTESSNLCSTLNDQFEGKVFKSFKSVIDSLSEQIVASTIISSQPPFYRYGLTDTGIIEIAKSRTDCLVLTDDFPLSNFLMTGGYPVINFNHIRSADWLTTELRPIS